MVRTIFFLLAFFGLPVAHFGQDIYLKFDQTCMDRLEYTTGHSTAPYVSYSFKLVGNKMAIMDIGQENAKWVKDLPGKVVYCNTLPIDKALVQQINDGNVRLFMVRESPTHYNVSQVDKALFYQIFDKSIDFNSVDADFVLYTDNLVTGVNLSRPTSKMEVYLDGTSRMQCSDAYILRRKENFNSENYKEFVLIPDVGIVEKRSVSATGFNSSTLDANALKLDKINGIAFNTVLSGICDKLQASYYDGPQAVPTSYGSTAAVDSNAPTSVVGDPCAPSNVDGLHIVQKGETMYGISKRYGVSLDQMRSWNNLQDVNVISLCQRLYVKDPSMVNIPTTTTVTSTTTVKGETTTGSEGYWITAPEMHTVRPAETVAGLAYTYGYTEDRFRKMNSLGANEGIVPGQKLRTTDCVCPTLESTTKDKPLPYSQEPEKIATTVDKDDVYFRPVKVHQVKQNETLFSIAKLYDTTVERLMELNGFKKGEGVTPDQRIYVQ